MPVLALAFVVCSVYAASEASSGQLTSMTSVKAMEQVFSRSEEAHSMSMSAITSSMSPAKAWQVLEKNNLTTPALIEITNHLQGKQSNLRKAAPAPKTGYSGVDKARELLNHMIHESMVKYDEEISSCTEFYAQQCGALEDCRGQIAASNFLAADSRQWILDAQSTINTCQVDIPTRKLQLKQHLEKCKDEKSRAMTRLKIVEGDIEVLTSILKMTDCDKKLVQMEKLSLLHCQDPCTKKSFVTFNQDSLKQKVSQLQSSVSHGLMQDTFKDLFDGIAGLESVEFLQLDAHQTPIVNKTKFNNPPLPRTDVPLDPCTDKAAGAPTYAHKRAAKCTIAQSPQCYKLQERFLLIQAGVKDEREDLLDEISFMEESCQETEHTLQSQIEDCQSRLGYAQTKLAESMSKEANAAEAARHSAMQNEELNKELKTKMKTCSKKYIQSETEMCALKKIRGELYKMKGTRFPFFQDCIVGKWKAEECTKKCSGGEQKLTRSVMTGENKGAKCLPLFALKKCNLQPCPVDCKLSTWDGWSKCSAQCGGGVQQRLREVKVAMKFGGKPCDSTSDTQACNNQACEKDCELRSWTKWTTCSKDCDGGTQKRQKFISQAAEGAGKCPGRWSRDRLEYKECNMNRCKSGAKCSYKLDVVLLLDGSGSLGKKGWNAEIKAAQTFIDAFDAKTQFAVVLYSGPRTWGGVFKCFKKFSKNIDMAKTCKIKTVQHFTSDLKTLQKKIAGLQWPKGSTLTSLALLRANSELSLGRKDAASIVVTITDGRPLYYKKTGAASRIVRKAARLVWVPVTRYAPLGEIRKWATRRWQENVVQVKNFEELQDPASLNHLVANICPARALNWPVM